MAHSPRDGSDEWVLLLFAASGGSALLLSAFEGSISQIRAGADVHYDGHVRSSYTQGALVPQSLLSSAHPPDRVVRAQTPPGACDGLARHHGHHDGFVIESPKLGVYVVQ